MPPSAVVLAFLGLVSFVALKTPGERDYVIYFLTAALVLAIVTSRDSLWKAALRWKTLTWLGTISYSLYMCHWLILWCANQVFRVVLKRPEVMVGGRSTPSLSLSETIVAQTTAIAVVLVVATLLYRFVEDPMRRKSRRVVLG